MTARQPTKPQPATRPVVRVVIDFYRKRPAEEVLKLRGWFEWLAGEGWSFDEQRDYRRPRVVSVRRVRGGK